VTVTHTVADSFVGISAACAGAAAEAAANRKEAKYIDISRSHLFFPVAFETMGPINQTGSDFLSLLGRRLATDTDDLRESFFLFRRLSIAIQRYNTICFIESFCSLPDDYTELVIRADSIRFGGGVWPFDRRRRRRAGRFSPAAAAWLFGRRRRRSAASMTSAAAAMTLIMHNL
jgi:hypothetical protein